MKKIGILTWYQHHNYGTILQAYALASTVSSLGYIPMGINYVAPPANRMTRLEMLLSPRKVWGFLRRIQQTRRWGTLFDELREERFRRFRTDNIPVTEPLTTSSELFELNDVCDAFVCGSDQIWTLAALDTKYYLDFVIDERKMVAYAPSLGISRFPDEHTRRIVSEQLKRFHHLSVREQSAQSLLMRECGVYAEVMPDPTLLLTREQWDMVASPPSVAQPYLLCYFLGQNEAHWRAARRIAQSFGLLVVVVPVFAKDKARGDCVLDGIGPQEFLGLVRNASFVCTDSFHGTLFSVLYERPFRTFKRFSDRDRYSQNARIYDFLRAIGLGEHLHTGKGAASSQRQFNWDEVRPGLSLLRSKGLKYLQDALAEATASVRAETTERITNTCCGCGACYLVCPARAITMVMRDGFLQSQLNRDECVHCGRCKEVCAFRGKRGTSIENDHAALYMARSRSAHTLAKSSSGGVAHEIARYLNKCGLPVLGCVFYSNTLTARHVVAPADCEEQLGPFQGSKYVQSDFGSGFSEMLEHGRGVVIGLPCQIAGADRVLQLVGKRDDFMLVDLVCHGVPTYYLLQRYIRDVRTRHRMGRVSEVHFRYKPKGWRRMHVCISDGVSRYVRAAARDDFFLYFELQNCYMRSCYECRYRSASCADVRLGDYWGPKYSHCHPGGASMVISMSQRGHDILSSLARQGMLELHEEPLSDYYTVQFPQNPIIPLYWLPLIQALGDQTDTRSLKALARSLFPIPLYNRQLGGFWHKLRSIMKV